MQSKSKSRYVDGRVRHFLIAGILLMLAACANQSNAPDRLYTELGGEPGIARIVDGLIRNIAADARIRHHFTSLHIAGFRGRLETHFCEIAGGPCTFDGRSMRESHRLLDISDADFNALVENLIDAMDELDIDHGTQNRFLARLAPMQPNIVSSDTPHTRQAR